MSKYKTPTTSIKLASKHPELYRVICCYCTGPMRRGGLDIDGDAAHVACHREASK